MSFAPRYISPSASQWSVDTLSTLSEVEQQVSRPGAAYLPAGGHTSPLHHTRTLAQSLQQGNQSEISLSSQSSQDSIKQIKRELSGANDRQLPPPPKRGSRAYRYLRWNFGSVYRRIFTLAFLGNIAALVVLSARAIMGNYSALTYQDASAAVSANLLAALAIRNEHVVNALFHMFGTWPRCLPLRLRYLCAKVYAYGGIHSGCSVAATFWYAAFLVLLTRDYVEGSHGDVMALSAIRAWTAVVSYGVIVLLVTILVFAHPRLRVILHNTFEAVHRFMGWAVVLLFWAQVLLITADLSLASHKAYGAVLAANPSFWMLLAVTALVVYPWTRLRLRDVEAEPLSDHCIKLNFKYRDAHYGQAIRLSDAPLKETHAFATIPNPPYRDVDPSDLEKGIVSQEHQKGFSVIISNAGDWTNKVIHNPPTKLYTRGVPQYGVLRVAGMFEPVIVMATGSGIAPCLSLFVEKPDHPVRIIWSAPSPLATFGQKVIDAVYAADPNAVIIDTRKSGRPDLVKIAYNIWEESRRPATPASFLEQTSSSSQVDLLRGQDSNKASGPCQAVVIISNQKVTRKVVYGLESRGIAAYGAIFDS